MILGQNFHLHIGKWGKYHYFWSGADMNWSVHIDNEKKDIWIIGKEPTQGLDHNTLTEEVIYPINFTQPRKSFVTNSN